MGEWDVGMRGMTWGIAGGGMLGNDLEGKCLEGGIASRGDCLPSLRGGDEVNIY